MPIRTNTNPRPLELTPELQDILLRNGMQAHVAASSNGFALLVQGHDSPLLNYPITEKQLKPKSVIRTIVNQISNDRH